MINYSLARTFRRCRFCLPVLFWIFLTGCGILTDNEDRLNRAEEAIADGEFRAAIIDAKDVLRSEPDNVRGRLLLARASVETGDGATAEKEIQRAIELGVPMQDVALDYARALAQQGKFQELIDDLTFDLVESEDDKNALYQLHGGAYLGLNQPQKARKLFGMVLESKPDSIDAKLGIVASHEVDRNFAQARATLDEIVTAHADEVRGWIASGVLHLGLKNYEGAESNFNVALRLAEEQGNVQAQSQSLAGLAEALFAQNKNDQARETVAQLLLLAPDTIPAALLDARVAYMDEDWSRAQQNLQLVLRVSPDNRQAQLLLGSVHLASGNLSQAEMYLSTVVTAMPQNVSARQMLAQTRLAMRKLVEAQETLEPVVSVAGADARSLSLAAAASAALGEFDSAIEYLEQSLVESPGNSQLQFQLVTNYLNAGRHIDAERVLREMDVEDTSDDEFRRAVLLVLTNIRNGDVDAALAGADSAAEKWPGNPEARLLLGSVHLLQSNYVDARENFEAAGSISPDSAASHRYLAAVEEADGNFDVAQSHYEAVLKDQPEASWAMFALARLAALDNDTAKAAEWLERVRTANSTAIEPRVILGRLYLAEGKYDAAETVINEALAQDDSSAELHNLMGTALVGQENYRAAASSFRRATEIDGSNTDYRLNYAKTQSQLGNGSLALQILEEHMQESLSHLPTAASMVWMKVEAGDLVEVMALIERIRKVHPESAVPYAIEAEVHVREGNLLEASKAYDRALDIEVIRNHALRSYGVKNQLGLAESQEPLQKYLAERPLDNEVRILLAESYSQGEDYQKAIGEYQQIISGEPDNAVALNNLAWIYFVVNDARAKAMAEQAYELLPDSGSVADTLGWILVNRGSVEEGIDMLRNAVDLAGERAEVRYHLAAALSKAGQNDEAREILQAILSTDELFNSRAEAQRLLAQL
jgi:putative PEP-CTERM system TPR-repeat lipoprotein